MTLKNRWYAAAWAHELADQPLARVFLGEQVVLYRDSTGAPVALADRCRHRALPLSMGRVIGDQIECGYHGLRFAPSGDCVLVPGQSSIPPGSSVRSYPAAERHGWVWIWMGAADRANLDDIPDLYWHEGPGWLATGEVLNIACNYMLLVDIQLDNTHATYVHPATLGSGAIQDTPPDVIRDGENIHVQRWMLDVEPPPIWAAAGGFSGNVDRWILAKFSPPSLCAFDIGAAAAGSGAPDGDRSRGITMRTSHFITPETETSCHYFWLFARNYGLGDTALSDTLHAGIAATFHEDVEVVEAQQRNISLRQGAVQIDINADTPTIQARRLMDRLIAAEAVTSP